MPCSTASTAASTRERSPSFRSTDLTCSFTAPPRKSAGGRPRREGGEIDEPFRFVVETHFQTIVGERLHVAHAPRRRRDHSRGAIFFGCCLVSHNLQSSISSSRCCAAHSSTSACERRG